MKKGIGTYYLLEIIISFILAFLTNNASFDYDFMTAFGLINLILSGLGILVAVVALIVGNKETGLDMLISSGLLLLTGVGVCSAFPWHYN